VQGDDCERQPVELLPFAQISKFLKEGKRVTVVAFSQGAIAGIACSFEFREALSRVVLFNSASMFWPPWLDDSSPFSERLFSYVVEGDPLSDGIRNSYVAPRVPGTTVILPTRSSGFENHHLHWFEKGPENCQQAPGNPEENDVVGKVEMTEGLELSRSGDFD
jgi:pimeloyl-ACP methyl ester carboxylesterase